VHDWSKHEGRHAFDGYLEDVMALHAQGVDPADDRSARVFVKDGKLILVSTNRETLDEIGGVLKRGAPLVGKLAKRPDEDTLEQMLRDAPFSRGLAPPSRAAKALLAHEDAAPAPQVLAPARERDDADDGGARPRRGASRRSTQNA